MNAYLWLVCGREYDESQDYWLKPLTALRAVRPLRCRTGLRPVGKEKAPYQALFLFDFFQGDADEGAVGPERMRKGEGWGGAGNLIAGIVEHLNEVDVDRSVGIDRLRLTDRSADRPLR